MGAFTIQAEIDEYGDLLDTALEECKRRGDACALAEAEYYSAKARAVRGMVADGQKATLIPLLVKGDLTVNKALEKWRRLEVAYDNAKEARNVFKKKYDFTREQYQREWTQAGMQR